MAGVFLEDISPGATARAHHGHVVHDNRDDRRQVYHLLARLSPRQRLAWLEWACRQAVLPGSRVQPRLTRRMYELARRARWDTAADTRLTMEVFFDLWQLDVSYHVDFERLLTGLEQLARNIS